MRVFRSQDHKVILHAIWRSTWRILTPVLILLGLVMFRSEVWMLIISLSTAIQAIAEKMRLPSGTLALLLACVVFALSAICTSVRERVLAENVSETTKKRVDTAVRQLKSKLDIAILTLAFVHPLTVPWAHIGIELGLVVPLISFALFPLLFSISEDLPKEMHKKRKRAITDH